MGEDVPHGAKIGARPWPRLGPIVAGQRRHAPEHPFVGPADEPHAAVALRPVSDAVFVRFRAQLARLGERFGLAARVTRAVVAKRAFAAAWPLWPADGRAEIHHRLDEV